MGVIMGVGRNFSRGGGNSGFSRGSQKYFSRRAKVMEFHFSLCTLRKTTFPATNVMGKYQISKSMGAKASVVNGQK